MATIRTARDLREAIEKSENNRYYFSPETMKFWGDTMSNYQVTGPVEIEEYNGVKTICYVLSRKKPVKHGLKDNAYFCAKTFRKVFPARK